VPRLSSSLAEHITDAAVVTASPNILLEEPRAPNGIRTRAVALKGRCPRPLDDGGSDGYRRSCISPPSGTDTA
jgi:hypothetical protein